MSSGTGKLANIILVVFAVMLAITSIVGIGLTASYLVKFGKSNPAGVTGDLDSYNIKLALGVSVILFITSVGQIIVCVLSIFDRVKFLVWVIIQAVCILVYLILFSILCHHFAHANGGPLPHSLIAFSGFCWILTIIGIAFLCLLDEGGGGDDKNKSNAPSKTSKSRAAASKNKPQYKAVSAKSKAPSKSVAGKSQASSKNKSHAAASSRQKPKK